MFSKVVNFRNLKQLTQKNKKFFDLHEYQSKDIMRQFNIRVQKGDIATTPEQAQKVSEGLSNAGGLILKAQVHAGGRGKGTLSSGMKGGVQILNTPQEVAEKTKQMIGYNLVTHQTRKDGLPVKAVLIHEGVDIVRQIYLAFILDRGSQRPCLVVSNEGGVEIEAVAKENPDAIHSYPFEPQESVPQEILDDVVQKLGLQSQASDAKEQIQNLYNMFRGIDASQVEINPWATDPSETLYCVDAKLNIDDNAGFRQKALLDLRKNSLGSEDVDVHEEQAQAAGLSYVGLDGNIGCLVNGAGLAMATMDVIKLHGAEPANFLDVGGGASVDQVKTAFEILTNHPSVEVIFINIFGGILSCQTIAEGITKAAQLVKLDVPLVCRLYGNAYIEGKELLTNFAKENNMDIRVAGDMDEGAKMAAAIVNKQ